MKIGTWRFKDLYTKENYPKTYNSFTLTMNIKIGKCINIDLGSESDYVHIFYMII